MVKLKGGFSYNLKFQFKMNSDTYEQSGFQHAGEKGKSVSLVIGNRFLLEI